MADASSSKIVPSDINLEKYMKLPESEIYLDPRPRIKNIVRELEEEHGWSWPPQPPKDFEKVTNVTIYSNLCPFLAVL